LGRAKPDQPLGVSSHPNPRAYAALLSASAAAIRAADAGAIIVAAPLAPTVETGPENLAEPLFLRELYEGGAAGAFDVVAAKPYGFDSSPLDRTVDVGALNFSRAILIRETMEAYGDGDKAIWAGNWGWNALGAGWSGAPSIWGQVDEATQARYTAEALQRARQEWPWMGLMFLENWEPNAAPVNPSGASALRGGLSRMPSRTSQSRASPTRVSTSPTRRRRRSAMRARGAFRQSTARTWARAATGPK
jgi:hypothetical protein